METKPSISNALSVAKALSQRSKVRELTPKEKALQKSAFLKLKAAGLKPQFAFEKYDDKIYSMAVVAESPNLTKEEKLTLLDFIYEEKDMRKVVKVIEKYVEPDDGFWARVVETVSEAKKILSKKKQLPSKKISKVIVGK